MNLRKDWGYYTFLILYSIIIYYLFQYSLTLFKEFHYVTLQRMVKNIGPPIAIMAQYIALKPNYNLLKLFNFIAIIPILTLPFFLLVQDQGYTFREFFGFNWRFAAVIIWSLSFTALYYLYKTRTQPLEALSFAFLSVSAGGWIYEIPVVSSIRTFTWIKYPTYINPQLLSIIALTILLIAYNFKPNRKILAASTFYLLFSIYYCINGHTFGLWLPRLPTVALLLALPTGISPQKKSTEHPTLYTPQEQNNLIEYLQNIGHLSHEEEYWESRYAEGGKSGRGSTGKYKRWKHNIIKKHVPHLSNVIDIGCGDLKFWGWRQPAEYIGIDISKTIIERNKRKRPHAKFIHTPAENHIPSLEAPVVLCLDLLFHIMNDETYHRILENLCHYSTDLIFIYTWHTNPLGDRTTDNKYQTYRPIEKYLPIFTDHNFNLIETALSPHDLGAMYVLKRGVLPCPC